jgi:hypothetical protein
VFQKAMGDSLKFSTKGIEQGLSFRNWMNKNLPNTPWARFGMNLAIGHPSDVPITNEETMYIPENMRIAFNSATNGGKTLVTKSRKIFTSYRPEQEKVTPFTPLLIFSILLVFGSALTYYQISKNIISTLFDTIFLIATGIFGLLILFLWFFTVHGVTMYNWNLLWALPTNIILAFMLKRKSKFVEAYLSVYQIILLLAIILGFIMSFFKSEIYPWAILPILTLLLIRVSFIKKYSKTNR